MYMVKTLVPTGLSTLYGYPDATHGLAGVYYLALILPLAVLAGLIYGFRKSRALFFGLGFFVSCIFLLLQLMPVGRALMADRYMYIASIGLFFCAGFAMEKTPQTFAGERAASSSPLRWSMPVSPRPAARSGRTA